MDKCITLQMPSVWQHVREARNAVSEALDGLSEEVRSATIMTSSELIENAMKFSERLPEAPNVTFTMRISPAAIVIEVVNGAHLQSDVAELAARIQRIAQTDDRRALYLERLREMLAVAGSSGKLGLYRIGYEGKFDLTCTYLGNVVTVRATRSL